METVARDESRIEVADWQMDITEFDANGCLINSD